MTRLSSSPTTLVPKEISRPIGSVKIRLARSQTSPRSKMSLQLERVDEALEAGDDLAADVAQRGDLLLHPVGGLVDHAVVVEHLGDQRAAGHQLDQRAQEVRRGPVGPAAC